jgi:uncharacterized protein (TIGR02452 family)
MAYVAKRIQNVALMQQNLQKLFPSCAKVCRKEIADSGARTELHQVFPDFDLSKFPDYPDFKVEVVEQDCITATLALVVQGLKPAMLNMACAHQAGGGVLSGASAQEEEICRRLTLYMIISNPRIVHYPLPKLSTVYTPGVFVLRDPKYAEVQFDPATNFAVITSAALRKPTLHKDGKFSVQDMETTLQKIELFFQTALMHGHDAVVPSAWGCGAYGQHPKWVSKLFIQVLQKGYARKFRNITFAIIGGDNFEPFHKEFAGVSF